MKIQLFFVFMFAFLGASAQPGTEGRPTRSPQERAQMTVTRLGEKMTLTADKKDALTEVFTDFFQKMQASRENGAPADRETLAAERDKQVQGILNEAEFAEYKEIQADMQNQRQQWSENRPNATPENRREKVKQAVDKKKKNKSGSSSN